MAVELLVLANDGPGGREAGAIIHVKECKDGETCKWGTMEKPPFFNIIHIEGVTKKTLDPKMLEYGGHRSRMVIDKSKLDKEHKDDIDAGKTAKVSAAKFMAAAKDKGTAWMPTAADVTG
jgi:hypothetical protein